VPWVAALKSICTILLLLLACSNATVYADSSGEVICYVDKTDDLFRAYPDQLIFESKQFSIYQLINGLTVLILNKQTMRFNRFSNLNLLSGSTLDPEMPPEAYQYFTGRCDYSHSTTQSE
jgi:hypothetical protein